MGYRIGIPFHVTAHSTDDGLLLGSCTVFGVVVGKAAAGVTLKLYDCAAIGDVAAGNLKSTIELDTRDSYQFGTEGASFRLGLVAVVSGACDVTVVAG